MDEKEKQTLLERYAELKLAVREAENELKNIQTKIKGFVDVGVDYAIGGAVITLMQGKTQWVYTEGTLKLEEDLKRKKKEEEEQGLAVQSKGEPYLACRFKKSQDKMVTE